MASIVVGRTCIQATLYVIGRVDVKRRGCCVIVRWQAVFVVGGVCFHLNNSLKDWESGLQEGGMLYCNGVTCCVVACGRVLI